MDTQFLRIFCLLVFILGFSCSEGSPCNERCQQCNDTLSYCEKCLYGWYGRHCNRKCENCWVTGCNHLGICDQCQPGRYREDCESICPENCRRDRNGDVFCERNNGKCQDGCKPGWWGDTCDLRCSHHCDHLGCLQHNGHCIGNCKPGWRGLKCDKECPSGCRDNRCECLSGKCKEGCMAGFNGEWCSNPTNCRDDRYIAGDITNVGECRDGCKPGWTSVTCDQKCPHRCHKCHQKTTKCEECEKSFYGKHCEQECSMNCWNGECDLYGRCTKGCIDGFTGGTCEETCPFNCLRCKQNEDYCTECKTGWSGTKCLDKPIEVGFEGEAKALTGVATGQDYTWTTIICSSIIWIFTQSC